jgi:hypothetical protein
MSPSHGPNGSRVRLNLHKANVTARRPDSGRTPIMDLRCHGREMVLGSHGSTYMHNPFSCAWCPASSLGKQPVGCSNGLDVDRLFFF